MRVGDQQKKQQKGVGWGGRGGLNSYAADSSLDHTVTTADTDSSSLDHTLLQQSMTLAVLVTRNYSSQ